jgi:hypothetical protein
MTKLGKNKGQVYEEKIFRVLYLKGLLSAPAPGTHGGVDAGFLHLRKLYKVEIKNGLLADYGQKQLEWSKRAGWDWSVKDSVTDFYNFLGALEYLQKKRIIPLRYKIKDKHKITYSDARKDQKAFEDSKFKIAPEALWRFYASKGIHYIQVGSGYGFYHLDEDVARLGTQQFKCGLILRFRMKYINRHKRERVEGKVVRTIPTPWNYSFFGVLKVKSRPPKSKYNLEKIKGQQFPVITP